VTSQPGQNPHSPGPLPRRTLRRGRLSGQCGWPAVHSLVRRLQEGPGQRAVVGAAVRCRARCAARPAGAAAVLGRPATPRTVTAQRLAAPQTATGGRPSPSNSGHWPEGPSNPAGGPPTGLRELPARPNSSGPATSTAAGATGGTALASSTPIPRRRRAPAQQFGGRQGGRVETGLRVAGVRTELLDLGDRRPGRSRRLRAPPRQHANATATAELLRANRSSSNGSGAPTRYWPNAAARSISTSQVGPSCQHTRHVSPHSTETLTCASSDSTLDHALAPSDRFTSTPLDRNEIGSTVTKRKSVPGYETAARSARNGRRSRGARQRAPVRPAVCSRDPTDRRSASNAPAPITYPTPGHRPGRWTIGRDLRQRARNPR